MDSSGPKKRWRIVNRIMATVLLMLTFAVSAPLSIQTYRDNGGPWGFGIVGLHILLPLTSYFIFAISALFNNERYQRVLFIMAHIVSLSIGVWEYFVFPFLPMPILLIPASLAAIGIINKQYMPFFLGVMISLGIAANMVLLLWEFDFGRTFPIIELFQSSAPVPNQDM